MAKSMEVIIGLSKPRKRPDGVPLMPWTGSKKVEPEPPAVTQKPEMAAETEEDEADEHGLAEKFEASRIGWFDGSEVCASCHHYGGGELCNVAEVVITDPHKQGCIALYQPAAGHEQMEQSMGQEEFEG